MLDELKAGVSQVDITPDLNMELAGYPHYPRHNTGVHDPLYATCLYLNDGNKKAIIIALDLVFYPKSGVKKIREVIASKTDIPEGNITICCTHTHSGPWVSDWIDIDSYEIKKPNMDYLKKTEEKIINAVLDACNNTFRAKIGVDRGNCGKDQGVGGNRLDPDGTCDPEVFTIGIKDLDGNIRACVVKYALHPTLIHAESTVVTSDYPNYIRKYLKDVFPRTQTLFLQGTSGNQSTRFYRTSQSFEEAYRIGTAIGAESARLLKDMTFSEETSIDITTSQVALTLRKLPLLEDVISQIRAASRVLDELRENKESYIKVQSAELDLLGLEDTLAYINLRDSGELEKMQKSELPCEVQILSIDDVRIVFLQGELFVEFGLEIKNNSPYDNTTVVSLANGYLPGYVCTKEAIDKGGYEAGQSMLDENAGDEIVRVSLGLLDK